MAMCSPPFAASLLEAEGDSIWKAFAAGSASAKAVFEFQRASWGVKGRSEASSAKPISPLDTPACTTRIDVRLKRERSEA